ncbi:phage holin family protein [Paraburkholderia phosphatilytica]|uniref:phage holin family protein n=1 Tax=Paraburkholderia phosphatilytica TaxID=2282883 RepID=UPI000E471BA3|nr:phage holin family protein [Paraburkholderia phosphatilytica]
MSIHSKLDRWRNVSRFLVARLSDYAELFAIELAETRARIMREIFALVALAVTGLFTLSFFCIALIASAWNTRYFLAVVWGIACVWLILSVAALLIVRAQRPAQSFGILKDEIRDDLETIKEALK